MAHDHLAFDLFNRFQSNTDRDHHGRSADCKIIHIKDELEQNRENRDDGEHNSADQDNGLGSLLQIICSRRTGTNTGDKAAVLLKIICDITRIIRNGRIEIREEQDQDNV